MSPNDTYTELKKKMREVALLASSQSVLYWDREANLPPKGSDHRADQLAQLNRLMHDWFVDPKVGDMLSTIEAGDLLKDPESEPAVNCREWRRLYDREVKLPGDFVEEFTRVTSKAANVWAEARKKSDFKLFQPHLEKIVELCRQKADFIGYTTERYDALLDEFEPGAKVSEVEAAFEDLRKELVTLIAKIREAPKKPDVGILKRPWNVDRQRIFVEMVAIAMGYDFEAGRLDEAVHPMCTPMGPYDTRIFSRYYPEDLAEGLTGVMHEAGHALYDQSHPRPELWGTPLDESASLAIHESQSRTWENIVGRSRQFWVYFFPQLKRLFREETAGVKLDDFYAAMNWVSPSYIRVEADEATYNLHIMLRFELERAMLDGDLKVADVPGEWNRRFKDYFGLEVDKDSNGCLQDVHWSDGSLGYFPTYALGNMFAAQFWVQAQKDVPGVEDDFARGEFGRLLKWLSENIHDQGMKYTGAKLCEKVTGQPVSHRSLIDYLYAKYEPIYGIRR